MTPPDYTIIGIIKTRLCARRCQQASLHRLNHTNLSCFCKIRDSPGDFKPACAVGAIRH
jgi:hypothetical protein